MGEMRRKLLLANQVDKEIQDDILPNWEAPSHLVRVQTRLLLLKKQKGIYSNEDTHF